MPRGVMNKRKLCREMSLKKGNILKYEGILYIIIGRNRREVVTEMSHKCLKYSPKCA